MRARVVRLSLIVVLATAGLFSAESAEVSLKAVSFQPERVVFAKHFYLWVREANDRCDGKLNIQHVEPGTIEPHLQWYALKTGVVDIYFGPANYYRGAMTHADVLNLAQNGPAEQRRNGAWAILNELHNEHVNAWYLTSLIAGVQFYIYTTKPARDGNFEGLRLRSVPMYDGFLRSLGADLQYMPAEDVLSALESGSLDGFGWPFWGLDVMGWEKHAKFRYGPGFMNTAAPILVNLEKWSSLDEDQRACLTDMAIWLEDQWPAWREAEDAGQLAIQQTAGVEFIDLGPEFAQKAEDIYWGMLNLAEPEYTARIKPLVTARH